MGEFVCRSPREHTVALPAARCVAIAARPGFVFTGDLAAGSSPVARASNWIDRFARSSFFFDVFLLPLLISMVIQPHDPVQVACMSVTYLLVAVVLGSR